ncbi:hypothetical protein HDU98_007573 [Podochytrium sp. JEL0797]|nr:hypothetical protein HDU98_007573 [Podochytrium sp. JEL0797]
MQTSFSTSTSNASLADHIHDAPANPQKESSTSEPPRASLISLLPKLSIPTFQTTKSADYKIKNPIRVSDVHRVLFENCETLARIGTRLKDQGRVARCLNAIYESFVSRKDDIKKHTKPVPTTPLTPSTSPSGGSVQTLHESCTSDTRLTVLQSNLYHLYIHAFTLSQLLSPISASSLGIEKNYSVVPVYFKRQRVLEEVEEVERYWQALMMHLTLAIARESSGTANTVTKNLHKLAIATGAPDWDDLTLDDGRLLFARGEKYILGLGVSKSYDLAFKAYLASAQCEHPGAMNMLGVMCETGMGREMDMVAAIKWFSQAAKKDCPEALNNLGRIYETGTSVQKDLSLSSTFYLRAAELGNPDAMVSLGYLLEHGLGKQKDEELAVQWYKAASHGGFGRGMNSLGSCFYRGVGVERDYGEAVQWYKKGAELGNAHAQNNLGICYEEGKGVVKDLVLAKTWYKVACDGKHPSATNNLGYMHLLESLQKNWMEAHKLFHLAWALGSADAAYNIGTMYESGCEDADGPIIDENVELAIRWYRLASEHDSTKAQIRLASLLTTLPSPRFNDAEIALSHLQKAVDKGSSEALNLMGQMKQLGIGMPDNEADEIGAFEHFSEGAKQGHAGCLFSVACCYEQGRGVERDYERSLMLFEEAARLGHEGAMERVELKASLKEVGRARNMSRSGSIGPRGRSRSLRQ